MTTTLTLPPRYLAFAKFVIRSNNLVGVSGVSLSLREFFFNVLLDYLDSVAVAELSSQGLDYSDSSVQSFISSFEEVDVRD